MASTHSRVYDDLPDLQQLYPDISKQYATLDSLKEKTPKIKGKGKGKVLDPMDVLLKKLPLSRTLEQIDELSTSFCPLCPSKANCNSLAVRLCEVDKLEIIPLYARMVATLSKCMSHISKDIFSYLLDDILKTLPKKSNDKNERKLILVSFIGELCLFGVAPPARVLDILKACLCDVDNLEVAKSLVERCGSFLLQNVETAQEMESHLQKIKSMERERVQDKQRQQEIEAEEEREADRKNQLVRMQEEVRREEEREQQKRVEQGKRLKKEMVTKLKEEERKQKKEQLTKSNAERKQMKKLKEEERAAKEREEREAMEREAKEREAKEREEREAKDREEREAKEREEKAKREKIIADAIERRQLILEVHNRAQELNMLKEDVWKREGSLGLVGLTLEERRNEEMEEEARLDEAINGHKERIGNLRRLINEVDYLTRKMEDEKKREEDMIEEARKVLEKEEDEEPSH